MRAWLMDSYEGIEQLRLGDVPDPQPGPNDVLLRVKLAALNPADAFLAQGQYPAKPPLPHILGRDYQTVVGGNHDFSSCSSRFGDQNILFLHDSECFHFYLMLLIGSHP